MVKKRKKQQEPRKSKKKPRSEKKNENTVNEEKNDEEELEDLVDAILGFKKSKNKKKGYEVLVKWQGYEEGNDTSWEPVKKLLQQWDCEANEIYVFFERENIDVSKCSDFDFISRKPIPEAKDPKEMNTGLKTNEEEKEVGFKDTNIQCGDIRDDQSVSEPDGHQDKEYICALEHSAKSGSLKGEDNPRYADTNYFLHGKKCNKCAIPFEGSEKLNVKAFRISMRNLVYACVDQACNYYMCGDCYTRDLLKTD